MSEPIDITGDLRSEDHIRLTRGMDDNDIRDLFMETYRLEEEVARLSAILASAYIVKPLEWSGGPYYMEANRFGLAAYGTNTGWGWCCMENGELKMHACESLDDGIDKAKAYDHARVTAPLLKVEVPS